MNETDKAYIAGLFDGEGSIEFKKRKEKKKSGIYNCIRISMEISMTDQSVLMWLHEVLGVGTLTNKPRKGLRKNGTKYLMQYRWRCTFRDAYYVCLLIWPFAHTKLPKIQKIIEHYSHIKMNGKVVNLQDYKRIMGLE
tara:strand:+ start:566 stop:979 length:414 start_codon:yes stop_codon:yes gene_type:complete